MDDRALGKRLHRAITLKGWTQSQLARRVKVTQPAISAILSGKRAPSRTMIVKLAKALAVDPDWLLRGTRARVEAVAMSDATHELSWHAREVYPDGTRQFGNARVEVFKVTLPIFARETGQNSNDAGLGHEVDMEFRLGILSGDRLQRFLTALQWSSLLPHYEAVAADRHHRTTRRYRDGLETLSRTQQLWVMRVDDYGTSGLVGDEFGEGCFSALVRRSQDSRKRSASAGGRFGLGSSVLSAVSAFDLVLFCSNLSTPFEGKAEARFIGRGYFPYHEIAGQGFEGPFFFGKTDPKEARRRLSLWANSDLLNDLWLERRSGDASLNTGTSALVVGFFDPENSSEDQSPDSVLTRLAGSFVDAFWPAITEGRLTASFSRYDNDSRAFEKRVDASNIVHPCVALLRNNRGIEERVVPLHIPKSKDTGSGPFEHNTILRVELLTDGDADSTRVNEVALWREPRMIVKYRSLSHITLGARPFRAALMCGEAVIEPGETPTPADSAAEQFLIKAEPPQHDNWTAEGTDLVAEFWGGRKALTDFDEKLREVLREIVKPNSEREAGGPQQLRELLGLPLDGTVPQRRAYISRLDWLDEKYEELSATIRLNSRSDAGKVLCRPILFLATETGGGVELSLTVSNAQHAEIVDSSAIAPHAGVRDLSVVLRPDWHSRPVRPDLSALWLDIAVSEKAEG